MKNTIAEIVKELEKLATIPISLGLRSNGLTSIALFFFFYDRFKEKEKYEDIANKLLYKALANASYYPDYYFASEFAQIGRTIEWLFNENFLEIDASEFSAYFEEPLMRRLRKDVSIDFGFQTGITGVCDLFLNKTNRQEALAITLGHIYSGLKVEGHPIHPIDSLFLFPSEILRDVQIFFLKLEKENIPIPQKELMEQAIRKLYTKKILQSNCPEYYILQDLREAEIRNDKQRIQSSLEIIADSSSNLSFKGLAYLSLTDNSLPAWWKLV